ncbi:MAG: protein kinase [Bryobacteraceae bacterium]
MYTAADPMIGLVLGHYRIRSRLGQGGMGCVYLGEREGADYRQRVAVKIASHADRDLLGRFRQERQLLAALDHPNIVRLIDGGAMPDGVPYLVMDCVIGRKITDYCRENHASVETRVELMRKVCAAVHYAHQRMVIHRDIKPSNILVTHDGEPKLLDFGIAKILHTGQHTELTQPDARPMTLRYASPEQVRGEAVTAASDVYALGTLLYELIAGKPPFEVEGLTEITLSWKICHDEPPSLRQTAQSPVDADLEAIVAKALRKEPEHRYSSAAGLAEDLGRYLEGQPVSAARGTWTYRLGKFARRQKAAFAASSAAAAILVAGIAGVLWQAGVANRQRTLAEQRFNDIHELSRTFLFDLHLAIERLPGSLPARRLIVEKAIQYLDRLAGGQQLDLKLGLDLALGYQQVGYLMRSRTLENLGDTSAAMVNFQKAARIGEDLRARFPEDIDTRNSLAESYRGIGDQYSVRGDDESALAWYKKALPLVEPSTELRRTRMKLCDSVGSTLVKLGHKEQAGPYFERALAISEAEFAKRPDKASVQRDRIVSYNRMAFYREVSGDLDGARAYIERAIAVLEDAVAAKPNDARLRRDLFVNYSRLGGVRMKKEAPADALAAFAKALALITEVAGADPANAQARVDVAGAYLHMGDAQLELNKIAEAIEAYRLGIVNAAKAMDTDQKAGEPVAILVDLYLGQGDALEAAGRKAETAAWYAKALDAANAFGAASPGRQAYSLMAKTHEAMGDYFKAHGRQSETETWYAKAREFREKANGKKPAPPAVTARNEIPPKR